MAKANADGAFYFCKTPQPNDLTKEQFEALEWIKIEEVGKLPESGSSTNIIKYDTIDTTVTQKAKGVTDAGGGTLEVAYNGTAPGQTTPIQCFTTVVLSLVLGIRAAVGKILLPKATRSRTTSLKSLCRHS